MACVLSGCSKSKDLSCWLGQVDSEVQNLLEQSGIGSLTAQLAAHGFTAAEDLRELEEEHVTELVALLQLNFRDKIKFSKMLERLQ
eukprot:926814-Rhodomonas_salina.1